MLTLFYVLVIEQILQGLYNLWDGLAWLRLAQRRAGTHSGFYAPRVALFCPVKGAEPGLELNISALTSFDYPEYEIFFSMANPDDPARKIIERVTAGCKHKIHIVVAGRPSECGEKVNNLRAAILKAGKDFDVFVFADSDGRPGRNWLGRLVAPLEDSKLGAMTTFRWFFPQIGGFWSALASAWNAPAATYLGEHDRNFCWGGGTAIRRSHFEQCNVLEYWNGSVSDDFSLTRALRQSNLPIEFAPECMVPTMFDCDSKGLIEFTNRQIIITRIYEPRLWILGGLGHAFYCAAIFLGVALFITSLMNGTSGIQLLLLATLLPVLSMGRGVLRLAALMELLPAWKDKLLADGWIWTFLAALAPAIGLWNTFAALLSRQILWRGVHYELLSPGQTRILSR